jgi:dTDP-4-dehydrorhamnose reductase
VSCKVCPIKAKQYPMPAKRLKNTLMNKDKIAETFNINFPDWKEPLNAYIVKLKEVK